MIDSRTIDIAYLGFVLAAPLALQAATIPKLKAKLAAGIPGTRVRSFQRTMVFQWTIALILLWLWSRSMRPWSSLRLTLSVRGAQLYASLAVAVLIVCFGVVQIRGIQRIAASPDTRGEQRERITQSGLSIVMPRTRREYHWMIALSITAGFCEELVWRGYAIWLLAFYVGLPMACVISAILFGLAHSYQGLKGIVKTAVVGGVMGAIVVLTGSLLPAMLLHALVDLTSARYGYVVCGDDLATRPA